MFCLFEDIELNSSGQAGAKAVPMLKYAARHQSVWWNVYLIPGVSR
jgi:hypothetical protein